MSSVFSKNKGKRSRTSSGESNNSFVKNVTTRVSGLLPATLTKWFSSPRSSSNGSAGGADATDSSTEDEGMESPMPPPNKRMRRDERPFGSADASCVTNNVETMESSTQYTVQSPSGQTTFRRETNFVSTPIRPDETMIDRTEDRKDKESMPILIQNTTAASIGLSASRKRKSLFKDKTQELSDTAQNAYAKTSSNTLRDPRQPTFKPTLLGSPFYAGKTTYGGAASSYINQPNISQRQNTTVKEAPSTSDNNMSTSARRILELLESYSSPLMDAKRIPQYTRPTRQEVLKRHSDNSASLSLLSPYNKTNSYKTQELHVPSIASILRLKQRSRLDDCTNAARQLVASHSSSSPDYSPYPSAAKNRDQSEVDGNSKFTTKVKTKRSRIHENEANTLETETITPVELPKAVLQIDPNNLPNFNIPVSSKSSSIEKPALTTPFATSTVAPKTTSVEKSKSESTTSNSIYNFANPVRITSESPKPTSTPPKFTFGSPERSIDKPLVSENTSEPSIILGASKESEKKTEAAAADWNCPDCWVKNKSDAASCVCCGHKHRAVAAETPALPAKCSLCKLANTQPNSEKCVNCAKVQVNNIAKPLKADTTAKWSCKDCWASNDDASDKCACCGAANHKKKSTQTVPAVEKSGGMCSKCFSTKNSDGTCSKCAESQPDNTFKIVLKSHSNKWECEHCLVRNDSDKTKCICCEAERSGAPKQPEKKQFNFGTVNTTFKFGIDPKVQEANLAKMSEKLAETKDKVEESETNNNVLAKAPPTFSFGIPAKKSEDQLDTPKLADKVAESPKATFTFGVPKQNSLDPTSTPAPMFGIPNKLTEVCKESEKTDTPEEKEKPVLNDKPEEAKKADEPAKPPVMMFGLAPLADKSTTNQLLSTAFTLKKDAPSALLTLATTNASSTSFTLATTSTPAPILTFSAPTTGSAEKTGIFGAAATSAPATTISFAPTTTASATSDLSMFQKTDEKPVNIIFQKSEPSSMAPTSIFSKSDAPAPAAAPMFSFGSSQALSGEKPSFNFTFGSNNKSDVFKPPTFAAKDSSTTVNKFSLGGSSTENPLAPNPVAGGNGLSATNSLTNNSLGGNGLSVNPLAVGLSPGNSLTAAAPSVFGSAIQKESSWTPPNNSAANPFNANATTNSAPKPFSFGSSTPFSGTSAPAFGMNNAQTSTPAFGSNLATSPPAFGSVTQPAAAPAFGASQTAATPAFGSIVQSTPNIFGMPSQNSQTSIFPTPNQNPSGMFGSPAQPAQAPALSIFGRPNVAATPTFGTPNPSIPNFEAPSVPAPAPSFNFGTPQTSSFMFGHQAQQQAQQPQTQTGVYNFGAAGGQAAQVQFSMGSAPSAGVRRVRRGLRRTSQR